MTRTLYAGRIGDTVASLYQAGDGRGRVFLAVPADAQGYPTPVVFTVWDEPDGTQITDLLDADGTTAISTVTVPASDIQIPGFYGPDGLTADVWLKDAAGVYFRMDASPDASAAAATAAAERAEAAAAGVPAMWQPLTVYTANSIRVAPDGSTLSRIANGTSRATFDPTEQATWEPVIGKAGTIDKTSLMTSFAGKLDNASTSTNGAVSLEKLTKVDASGAARTMTLADGTIKGQQVAIEKTDSGTNAVTVTGKIRSTGAGSISLSYQYETLVLIWGGTYWEPLSGHRSKSSVDTQAINRTTRPKHAPALGLYFPEAEGAVGNGTADDTTAVNATLATIMAAGGGTMYLNANAAFKCLGAVVLPYTSPGASPIQKPVRITSPGAATSNGRWVTAPLNGGGTLDLRFPGRVDTATVTNGSATVADTSITALDTGVRVVGTGVPTTAATYVGTVTPGVSFKLSSSPTAQVDVLAISNGTSVTIDLPKIDTRGAGLLEIDHVNLISGGSDDAQILRTTNTTVHIHHCYVQGNLSKSQNNCKQDAFVLGGLTGTIGDGASAPFQGYGSHVHDNYFTHVRRGVWGRSYCNSTTTDNNTFSTSCGNDGSTIATVASGDWTMGGAIEFCGNAATGFVVGNITRGNTIEVPGYKHGIAASWAIRSTFGPDGFWDVGSGPFVAGVFFDTTAQYNTAVDGFTSDLYPLVLDYGLANKVETNAQSRASFQPQTTIIRPPSNPQVHGSGGSGWHAVATSGDASCIRTSAGSAASPSYPEAIVQTIAGTTVTDLVIDSTTRVVSSATANWTRQHQYAPIKATGIVSGSIIVRWIDASHVEISALPTTTASGVTAQFGPGTTAGGTARDEVGFTRGGHIVPKGAIGAAAAPPAALGTAGNGAAVSVTGKDTAFILTITTASTGTGIGTMATVAWGVAFTGSAGVPVLTPMNQAAAEAKVTNRVWAAPTNSNFVLMSGVGTLPTSTTMIFGVHMMQS